MRHLTQLSRADVLACLQVYGEAQLDEFAAALGYTCREPTRLAHPSFPATRVAMITPPVPIEIGSTAPDESPRARFYRVVAQRQLEPAEVISDEPAWFRQAEPYREEIRAKVGVRPPLQPPLMPWPRLWPFLKTVLGARLTTRALDIPRIIARLARGQPLRHIPRKTRHGWASTCQIVMDYATSLQPCWADLHNVQQRLRQLRGVQGLTLYALPDGDPDGRCLVYAR